MEDRLRDGRTIEGRPQELSKMTTVELAEEKTALQKALLYYESLHGRPCTRDAKELARPLYDRYRLVKRSVSRAQMVGYRVGHESAPPEHRWYVTGWVMSQCQQSTDGGLQGGSRVSVSKAQMVGHV